MDLQNFLYNILFLSLMCRGRASVLLISGVQPPLLTISSNLAIVIKLGDPKCLQKLHLNSYVTSFSRLIQSRGR